MGTRGSSMSRYEVQVSGMRGQAELDAYEIAYICGGPERVAMVVLVALHEDGRIRISSDRHRVYVVRRSPRDEVETAALEVIPKVGRILGLTVLMVAASPAVDQVGQELREKRLIPNSRLSVLWQWGLAKKARDLRRSLAKAPAAEGLARVAAMGAAGIADDEFRQIFGTHVYEPPVSVKLTNPRLRAPLDPLPEAPDRSGALYAAGSDIGAF
jgi:uncharacterized protein (TIGR04222 family)